MERDYIEILGVVAACCTTGSFLPQVIHTLRTKSVEDISLRMYLLLGFGIILWLAYGMLINSFAIIVANGSTLVLVTAMVAMKLRFKKKLYKPRK